MLSRSVKKLFKEQADYYSIESSSAKSSPLVKVFLEWAKKKSAKGRSASGGKIKIGEFGGAAGQLLAEIEKLSPVEAELYNSEIVENYRSRQVSKKIKFIEDSILDSSFENKFFDCLIIRDVLHHLIGGDLRETSANQKKALLELKRLIKPGGIILIEELVTQSPLSSRIIYILSKINSQLGINIPSLEISPNTIVSFLTRDSLDEMISDVFGQNVSVSVEQIPWNQELKSRLIHLGAKNWKMIVSIQ